MSDPITERAVQLLITSDHILMSVRDLYETLASEGLMSRVSPAMLEYLLESDRRFELVEGLSDVGFDAGSDIKSELREVLGGPLVRLRGRRTPPKAMIQDVLSHLQEMSAALEVAWHTRPDDDPQAEAELVNMLIMSDMLERELQRALSVYVSLDRLQDLLLQNQGDE
jgi:hypothetical protein